MTPTEKARRTILNQSGIALIEALVSAVLLLIVAGGVFSAFTAATRSTAQERHRARANDLAEADLERMRSLPVACPRSNPSCTYSLATLLTPQTRTVAQDGTNYTIVSLAEYVNETASTSSCSSGGGSRDYLKITSTVTWPGMGSRPAVTAGSIVTPPSGSVVPNSGSLVVSVEDSRAAGISGVTISGSGPGSFTGTTGSTGCVLWKNLPAGNYTMTLAGVAAGKVDQDGDPPTAKTISVVDQSTNTVELQYDSPGSMSIGFTTKPYGNGTPVAAPIDSMLVFNTGMTSIQQFVPTTPPATPISSNSVLFPFTSPYAVYAGTCSGDNPDPNSDGSGGAAVASVLVPQGGAAGPATVQLPALHLTVWSGSSSTVPGSRVSNAQVKIRDDNCSAYLRTFTTNSQGQLPNPGLPWSTYDICANNTSSPPRARGGSPPPTST